MMDFIARLQEKPLNIRKRILLLSSFSLTAFIVLVWISFSYLMSPHYSNDNVAGTSTEVSSLASFENIFITAKNAVVAEKQILQKTLKF